MSGPRVSRLNRLEQIENQNTKQAEQLMKLLSSYRTALRLIDDIIDNCSTTQEHIKRRKELPNE